VVGLPPNTNTHSQENLGGVVELKRAVREWLQPVAKAAKAAKGNEGLEKLQDAVVCFVMFVKSVVK